MLFSPNISPHHLPRQPVNLFSDFNPFLLCFYSPFAANRLIIFRICYNSQPELAISHSGGRGQVLSVFEPSQ